MRDRPDPEELVARARALVPALRERQEQAERGRRVPAASVADLLDAGLYRVVQPARHGGLEHGLDAFCRVATEIGAGCGSTGWVFSTGALHQWQIGMFDPAAQDDVWGADPRALAASSYAPTGVAVPVEGGYRLSGRWSFCSGCEVAQWMILGIRIAPDRDAKPDGFGFALVPKSDFQVLDTWHVFGLVGTGSHDLTIEDAFLPVHRVLTHAEAESGCPPGAAVNPGAIYRIPFFAGITVCLGAAIMGMARGALDEYLAGMRARQTRGAALGAAQSVAGFQTLQLRVGEAAACIDAAEALVLRDCRDIMAAMAAGETLTEAQRARNKGDLGFAVRLCVRAVDLLMDSVGGTGLYSHSRVQRFWRDLHAGSQHISVNWDAVGALYGRVQLGGEPGPMQF
jgi:resorcinol 4-hydroxylase (FADH2)